MITTFPDGRLPSKNWSEKPGAGQGHRIVQGGPDILDTRLATPDLLDYLDSLCPLAPDHQPHNLSAVRALAASRPGLLQTLSFDTSFHRTQPRLAQLYAIPRALSDAGLIRYGYHGLSYANIARRLPDLFPDRPIAGHLPCTSAAAPAFARYWMAKA